MTFLRIYHCIATCIAKDRVCRWRQEPTRTVRFLDFSHRRLLGGKGTKNYRYIKIYLRFFKDCPEKNSRML